MPTSSIFNNEIKIKTKEDLKRFLNAIEESEKAKETLPEIHVNYKVLKGKEASEFFKNSK